MGGRSGQSITGTATISGGGNLTQQQKSELKDFANTLLRQYGIKNNITINLKETADKYAGHVLLTENQKTITQITVNQNTKNNIKSMIAHELTHVKQINNKQLFLKDSNIVWKGKKYMTIKEYKKAFGGKWTQAKDTKYRNLPWEKEAYTNENKHK